MAPLRRKINHQQPRFSAASPHFVKIIPANTYTDTKLRIPKKFVGNYGRNLANPICLKLPSGAEWEVEVTKSDGEFWFDKGWPEFSEFYCLEYGDLLVFRYEPNSTFHVCICDKSATEIDYPITSTHIQETDEEEDDDDVKPNRLSCPLPHKRKIMSTSRMHPLTENEKAIALQRADGFESGKPHFKVALQPACMKQLVVPLAFVKEHLSKQRSGKIILKVSDGGTWTVYCKYEPGGRFQQGWSEFVRDNNLKVGDVCVFILIKAVKLSFQVVFYHENSRYNSPLKCPVPHKKKRISSSSIKVESSTSRIIHTLTENEKAIALQRADDFVSEKPHFKVALQPSYISRCNLLLPSGFVKKHLIKQPAGDIILKVSNGGSWPVYFKYARPKARFHQGWRDFVRDNDLKVGDVCVFILISGINPSFEVAFYRTAEAANRPLSPAGKCKMGKIEDEPVTQSPTNLSSRALEAANKFVSHNPFFRFTVGSLYHVGPPVSFTNHFIKKKKKHTVTLRVKNRSWPVRLIAHSGNSFKLSAGWVAFAKENCLRKGDVCILELIDRDDILLKVHIFRR